MCEFKGFPKGLRQSVRGQYLGRVMLLKGDARLWSVEWALMEAPPVASCAASLTLSRAGETKPLWSWGMLQPVTCVPRDCPGCPEGCWSLSERGCQTEVSQTLSSMSAWHAEQMGRLLCASVTQHRRPKLGGPKGPRAGNPVIWGGWFEPSGGQGLTSMLLVLRREKGQHHSPKATGDATQKLAQAPAVNCFMGTCCSDALLNFSRSSFSLGLK